jgi:hypothetical protein
MSAEQGAQSTLSPPPLAHHASSNTTAADGATSSSLTPPGVSRTSSDSPDRTVVDLQLERHESRFQKELRKWERAEEAPFEPLAQAQTQKEGPGGAEIKLSQKRKWFLLFVFSVAQVRRPPQSHGRQTRFTRLIGETHWRVDE